MLRPSVSVNALGLVHILQAYGYDQGVPHVACRGRMGLQCYVRSQDAPVLRNRRSYDVSRGADVWSGGHLSPFRRLHGDVVPVVLCGSTHPAQAALRVCSAGGAGHRA